MAKSLILKAATAALLTSVSITTANAGPLDRHSGAVERDRDFRPDTSVREKTDTERTQEIVEAQRQENERARRAEQEAEQDAHRGRVRVGSETSIGGSIGGGGGSVNVRTGGGVPTPTERMREGFTGRH